MAYSTVSNLLIDSLNLPRDVVRYCLLPYVFESTNAVRKRILRNRHRCLDQIEGLSSERHIVEKKVLLDSGECRWEYVGHVVYHGAGSVRHSVLMSNAYQQVRRHKHVEPMSSRRFLKRIGAVYSSRCPLACHAYGAPRLVAIH
jgi:hypothetical protein